MIAIQFVEAFLQGFDPLSTQRVLFYTTLRFPFFADGPLIFDIVILTGGQKNTIFGQHLPKKA